MYMTYSELNKRIANITHELRGYRLTTVLKTLAATKTKNRRVTELEKKLNKELNKTLQDQLAIDELLEEFESIL